MPLRGESVGSAYVRIYADGSAVPDGIRDALNDSEPSVREAGRHHGEAYEEEFNRSVKGGYKKHFQTTQGEMFEGLNDALTDRLAKLELARRTFNSPKWKEFLRRVEDEFGDAGTLAAKSLEERFRDSGDLGRLEGEMANFGARVRAAQADILKATEADERKHLEDMDRAWEVSLNERARAWNAMLEDAYRDNQAFDARWRRLLEDQDRAYELHIGALSDLDRAYSDRYAEQQAEAIRLNREVDRRNRTGLQQFKKNLSELTEEIQKLNDGTSRFTYRRLREWADQLERIVPSLSGSRHELDLFNDRLTLLHRRLDDSNPRLDAFDRGVRRVGDTMGRAFGLGSRNNFLNFFGSFVRMLTQAPRLVTGFLRPFIGIGRTMAEAFEAGGGGAAGSLKALQSGLGGIAGIALKAGAAIGGFAVFIGVLGLVLGPVVSLLSGLVGILTALGSSVIMGAIGAIAGFGPILLASGGIVAGIVAMTMAIKDASDAAPLLKRRISEVRDTASGLWDVFKDEALRNLPTVLARANRALEATEPLVHGAATGFRRFIDEVSDAVDSPRMDRFFKRIGTFLPNAMDKLGSITGNILQGVAGVLEASTPLANRMLNWLDGITEDFAKWSNSKSGRQEIVTFLDDAGDSASVLGGFLGDVWDFLWKIIGAGKDSGDSIFKRMGDDIERATKFFDDNPDALGDWFQHAEDTVGGIGEVVDGIIQLADTLDRESSRVESMYLFKGISFAAVTLANQIETIDMLAGGIGDSIAIIGEGFQAMGEGIWYIVGGEWVGDLIHGIDDGLRAASGYISGLFSGFWSDLKGSFSGMGGGGGLSAMTIKPDFDPSRVVGGVQKMAGIVSRGVQSAVGAFQGFAGRAAAAAGDVAARVAARVSALPGRVGSIADQVVARFGNIAERIGRAVGDVWKSLSSHFNDIPGNVAGVVSDIVGAFAGLAGRILAQVGHIDLGSLMHGSIDPPGPLGPWSWATGGIANHEMIRRIGEDGPEAVVPLNRDLSQVDPSVRALSAFAQGKLGMGMAGGGDTHTKVIEANGWQVITPSKDPRIVATEVLDELAAAI